MNDNRGLDPKPTASNPSEQESSSSPAPSQPYSGQPDDLHDLFAVNAPYEGDDEDPLAALRNDPNYSALIRDLEYIAKQARLLFEPAQEAPSDKVWENIQNELGNKPPDA
jgi:hypothetical protein